MKLVKKDIASAINLIYDAVDESKAGPMMVPQPNGEPKLNTLAYNTFLYLVQRAIPASAAIQVEEAKEDWEE